MNNETITFRFGSHAKNLEQTPVDWSRIQQSPCIAQKEAKIDEVISLYI